MNKQPDHLPLPLIERILALVLEYPPDEDGTTLRSKLGELLVEAFKPGDVLSARYVNGLEARQRALEIALADLTSRLTTLEQHVRHQLPTDRQYSSSAEPGDSRWSNGGPLFG